MKGIEKVIENFGETWKLLSVLAFFMLISMILAGVLTTILYLAL